jgi:hypothetical protein
MHGKIRATMKVTSHRQVETDRAIVTEWRFAPGAETGHHVHAHDYIVVPLTTGTLRLEEPEGVRINKKINPPAFSPRRARAPGASAKALAECAYSVLCSCRLPPH